MKKNLLSLSILTLSVMGLVGCNSNNKDNSSTVEAPKYTITLSGSGENREITLQLAERFKATSEAYSGLTFDYREIGEDKVDSAVADWTTGPDVYSYASDKIIPLFAKGAMSEVPEDYLPQIEAMGPSAVGAAKFAGKTLAYPYDGGNGYFLYYNKNLLKAEDVSSIEGLLAKATTLGMKVAYELETAFYSMGLLFTFGADWQFTTNSQGAVTNITADFNSDKGIKAGKALVNIMTNPAWQNSLGAPTGKDSTVGEGETAVKTKIVACVDGTWNAPQYKQAMGDAYACTKLPTVTVDGETKNLSSFLGYKLFGVNPQTSSGDATRLSICHALANYLVGKDAQDARFDARTIVPTNREVLALDKVQKMEHIAAIGEQAQYAHAQGALPDTTWTAPTNLSAAVKNGEMTVENVGTYMANFNTAITTLK